MNRVYSNDLSESSESIESSKMAECFPLPSQSVDPLELEINSHFDRVIKKVNARRIELLIEFREKREESRTRDTQRKEMISQIATLKSQIESVLKENPLKQMQQKMIAEMEKELEQLQITPQKKVFKFSINTTIFEREIETLGEISEHIDYSTFQPVVAVAKQGKDLGELYAPRGVAIDETTGHVYAAEYLNSRIAVFSQTGEYIKCFGTELFKRPWGIAICDNNLYLSDWNIHAIFHYKLPDMNLIQQVGKKGSGKREFDYPYQLFISHIRDVYVCDSSNHRIQVLTSDLKFKSQFTHETMKKPGDINLTEELMYVLSMADNPCLHVFTLTGQKIRSILSRGEELQITRAFFFCIDQNNNIVISDCDDHSIKIFTPEGELLHKLGQQGHEKGMFYYPRGITLAKEGDIMCVSGNNNYGLHIFS